MRECGNHVLTEEILRHHKDICSNPTQYHTYGAIDAPRFKTLASRYLKTAADFTPNDATKVEDKIKRGHGVFVFASAYQGCNHAMRAVAVAGQDIEFLVPAFHYGHREKATLDQVLNVWKGSFIEAS